VTVSANVQWVQDSASGPIRLARKGAAPVHKNEDARLRTLHDLNVLHMPVGEQLNSLCRIAAKLLDVPVVLISLLDESRQWFKASYGLDIESTSRDLAFCNYTVLGAGTFVVKDTKKDFRFESNSLVVAEPFIRFYAGAPLLVGGYAIGALCALDYRPRKFSSGKLKQLTDIASVVTSQLAVEQQRIAVEGNSEERKRILDVLHQQQNEMWKLAHQDRLTGIANRNLFETTLANEINCAREACSNVALAVFDLDNLKAANDTYGHHVGDAILIAAANRITEAASSSDAVARIGGDKFALILTGHADANHAVELVQSIQSRLLEPIEADNAQLNCAASVGFATFPDQADGSGDLLKNSDIALSAAKATARGSFVRFAPEMLVKALKRLVVEKEIREALKANKVFPYYQPKVSSSSGALIGFEALIRWNHPERGLQTPASIESVLDDPDLGMQLGDRMLALVTLDMQKWIEQGLETGVVFVNASVNELRDPRYAQRVLSYLRRADVSPHCFGIEMTETGFLAKGMENIRTELQKLSRAGVKVTLDDFGTGYGSLTHLLQFPIDGIKIDRAFTMRMESDAEATAIIDAMIGLAKNLDIDLVAEGVETLTQFNLLKTKGCPTVQGFLISKPVAASTVPELIASFPMRLLAQ
jgi:diguanylate cyclase (GGDEF)-like protein